MNHPAPTVDTQLFQACLQIMRLRAVIAALQAENALLRERPRLQFDLSADDPPISCLLRKQI